MNESASRSRWFPMALVVASWAIALAAYPFAPARVPIHWGVNGQVDDYAGPLTGIFLQPLLMTAIATLLWAVPRFDPKRQNYAAFGGVYRQIQVGILVFLLIMQALLLAATFNSGLNIATLIIVLVGGLFVFLGNLMGKTRPNWFVGIRTPWTLSSPDVWTRTHHFGGRLMVAMGLLYVLAGLFLPMQATAIVIIGGVIVLVVGSFGYSYWVWRQLGQPSEDHHA